MSKYTNNSQQTLLHVVECLSVDPLRPKTLATILSALEAQELTRDQCFRALQNLAESDWAEQVAEGWIISPSITHIAERMRLAIANTHNRYLEINL